MLEQFINKRILVCGGREYDDHKTLSKILHALKPIEIIQGGQKKRIRDGVYVGADYHALQFAIENDIPYQEFPANWDLYGKKAGFLRNKEMLEKSDPDFTVAFPGGKGTLDMITQTLKAGKTVLKVNEFGKIKILQKNKE